MPYLACTGEQIVRQGEEFYERSIRHQVEADLRRPQKRYALDSDGRPGNGGNRAFGRCIPFLRSAIAACTEFARDLHGVAPYTTPVKSTELHWHDLRPG